MVRLDARVRLDVWYSEDGLFVSSMVFLNAFEMTWTLMDPISCGSSFFESISAVSWKIKAPKCTRHDGLSLRCPGFLT